MGFRSTWWNCLGIGDWDKLSFTSFFFGVTSFMSFSDWAAFLKGGVELSGSGPIFKEKNRWMLFSDMSQSCDVKICYKFLLCPGIILWGCKCFCSKLTLPRPFTIFQQYLNKFKVFFQLTVMIQNLSLNWWQENVLKNLDYLFRTHWKSDNSSGI